jgi:Tol biopolymer transport system component
MRRTFLPAVLLALALAGPAPADTPAPAPLPWLSQPGISPDGREIAFVSGGDIWTVPAAGGDAQLLVSGPADDRRPLYSPDGRTLAFVSDRTGNGDVYLLTLATGALRRLTFDDGAESLDAWSPDGEWIYYSSTTGDIGGMNDIWRVRAAGGTPLPIVAERYTNEFAAAPAPGDPSKGTALLFCARGLASAQWWRNGHSHIDETEIWLKLEGRLPEFKRIVDRGAKSLWPMWDPQGGSFYYVSDRSGAENLWESALSGKDWQMTRFASGRVLWPTISRDGRKIAFERDFGIWTFDLENQTSEAQPVPVTLRGAPAGRGAEFRRLTTGIEELALSPDGKKIAFVVHGEVFAVSAADGGDAVRVTRTARAERHVAWAHDSRRIAWTSAGPEGSHVFVHDFVSGQARQLTDGPGTDVRPQFAPNDRSLAFLRDGRELRVVDAAGGDERLVATARVDALPPLDSSRPFAWSPDGRWLAFLSSDDRLFRNASVVEVAAASPRVVPVAFLANTNGDGVAWSPDGSALYFDSSQRTEAGQVARVDLAPRVPRFREQGFRDLFKEESKPEAGKAAAGGPKAAAGAKTDTLRQPAEVVREGLRARLTLLPVGVDVQSVAVSPDGKQLLLLAEAEGAGNLYLYPLDELSEEPRVARQLTSTEGRKRGAQFSPDGKTVWYLEDGGIVSIPVESRQAKKLAVSAGLEVDFDAEKTVVFEQAWDWLRTHFHDPAMNGADWAKVRAEFAPRVAAERTPAELARLLSMMVGELDASHCGVRPAGTAPRTTGRLGLRFDRSEYERRGELVVTGLTPLSPAAVTRKIAAGEHLLAVNGVEVARGAALEQLLENQVGREVRLTIAADAGGTGKREVAVKPVDSAAEKDLLYREWVEKNRALVDRLSGGRLGYVHMADMGYESLLRLQTDLDADNLSREGVVFDVRNNNGGFVNAYALDVLSRRHYLNMTDRGWPTGPARRRLGQRALERPTVLLTNQHSLSDAEDFAEGYRVLGLGRIVGEPTAGWIIYTSNVTTIDGSVVRLPSTTITTAKGEPMEKHPRPVDVEVRRALGEDAEGRDSQVERAVAELLAGLKR